MRKISLESYIHTLQGIFEHRMLLEFAAGKISLPTCALLNLKIKYCVSNIFTSTLKFFGLSKLKKQNKTKKKPPKY